MMDIPSIELGVFFRSTVEQWNRSVHLWLKYCIHTRLQWNTTAKIFLTFIVSAYWHGHYIVYYIAFIYYAIVTMNLNYVYKLFIKYEFLRKPIFHIILTYFLELLILGHSIFARVSGNYFFVLFGGIAYEKFVNVCRGLIWIPILQIGLFIVIQIIDKKDQKLKLDYPKYCGLKIYEIWNQDSKKILE